MWYLFVFIRDDTHSGSGTKQADQFRTVIEHGFYFSNKINGVRYHVLLMLIEGNYQLVINFKFESLKIPNAVIGRSKWKLFSVFIGRFASI